MIIMVVTDKDIIEVAHVLLLHHPVFPPLPHQPEGDEESLSVADHNKQKQQGPHQTHANNKSLNRLYLIKDFVPSLFFLLYFFNTFVK